MRVAHCSDLHLPDTGRHADTLRCLHALVADGEAQGVSLWLVAGDLGGTTVPFRHPPGVRNALADVFQAMARTAEVLIIRGNHDTADDIAIYERLSSVHPIRVVNEPQIVDVAGARVFCFPYPEKRTWRRPHAELPLEEQDRAIEADIRAMLDGWSHAVRSARTEGLVTIFLGHFAVGGALLAGGERQLPAGIEIELAVSDLEHVGADYTALGHLHVVQELKAASGIWYCGSPDRSNFGEETDSKGYLIADLAPGRPATVHRRLTPARMWRTFEATWAQDAAGAWGWQHEAIDFAALAGAEVRVRLIVPEEAIGSYDALALEKLFRDAEVHAYHPERRIVPKQEVRCPEIVQTESLHDQLRLYWMSEGEAGPDAEQVQRCLALLDTILAEEAAGA